MKKQLFLLFALASLPLTLWAGKVTREQALKTATDFMGGKTFVTAGSVNRARGASQSTNEEPFYVFNATDGGYVIVSGDDRTREILGYSQTGTLDMDNLPANLQWWLDEYARQIDALGTSAVAARSSALSEASDIMPLIHTQWSQYSPYNYMCPDGSGKDYYQSGYNASNRCVTGCVATAMAQVMNYWQWPESCPAIEGYSTGSMNLNSLPETTFKWDLMKDQYAYNETGDAANAVAELMRYCGQAMHMYYSTGGSGAFVNKGVMVNTFNYSPSMMEISRNDYDLGDWEEIIYHELAEGRPVLYSGDSSDSGHEFVIDGYSSNGLFHINWGWGKGCNDYFVLSIADPSQPGVSGESSSGGYRFNQEAFIGVKPLREGETEPYAVLSEDGQTVTLYYDGHIMSRQGMPIDWYDGKEQSFISTTTAATVVFDDSFADYHPHNIAKWFYGCHNLKEIKGLSNLNTDQVKDMSFMFGDCTSLTSLDLSGFKTSKVLDMSGMFYKCSKLTSLNLSSFKTDNLTGMWGMFYGCSKLTNLNLSSFKTDNVTGMWGMFYGCSGLTSLDLSSFKTDNVTDMRGMFIGCSGLTSLILSSFKTDNVTNMNYMFYHCSKLTSLDLSSFKTDNVTDMSGMFIGCSGLTSLDLNSFKTENVTNMDYMFYACTKLKTIYAGDGWSTESVKSGASMFNYCYDLIGGQGTKFNSSHADHTYAHIDGGTDNPGYFTYNGYTGIHGVTLEGKADVERIYDLQGHELSELRNGLNIVRMSDGTTKKIVVK